MSEKTTNESNRAFPERCDGGYDKPGMSLRDYFAAQALAGILSNAQIIGAIERLAPFGEMIAYAAKMAYQNADAMLTERSKS